MSALARAPLADFLRLRGVCASLTPERMRAAFTAGWIGWFAPSEIVTPSPAPSQDPATATAWGRYYVAPPERSTQVNLDGTASARFGRHLFILYWQIPGPDAYEMRGVQEVLLGCEEAKDGTSFAYLVEGAAYPSALFQPGFFMTSVSVPYRATYEATA